MRFNPGAMCPGPRPDVGLEFEVERRDTLNHRVRHAAMSLRIFASSFSPISTIVRRDELEKRLWCGAAEHTLRFYSDAVDDLFARQPWSSHNSGPSIAGYKKRSREA
jgi:hypothetical protein